MLHNFHSEYTLNKYDILKANGAFCKISATLRLVLDKTFICNQWRIQDFPQGGGPTPKIAIIFQIFAENCMKMKEFGPPGGARIPGAPLGSANGNKY